MRMRHAQLRASQIVLWSRFGNLAVRMSHVLGMPSDEAITKHQAMPELFFQSTNSRI
jgi:hypothetical protein